MSIRADGQILLCVPRFPEAVNSSHQSAKTWTDSLVYQEILPPLPLAHWEYCPSVHSEEFSVSWQKVPPRPPRLRYQYEPSD